ncbi:hypothetical protein BWI17_16625 [Betaproteobacteria bacterium GR16-43]|nr:hypothetical protein BWI17_16625 [Betaproteobacteria bacterium GR16-43]
MPNRPALIRLVADAADDILRARLAAEGFAPVETLQPRTIRRYVSARQFRDVEIEVFREDLAGGDGLMVRATLRVLVHPLQQATHGAPQSLVVPTPGVKLSQLQLGPHADGLPGSWRINGPTDVGVFAHGFTAYLAQVAMPWLAKSQSIDAVLALLREVGQGEQADKLRPTFEALQAQETR